MSWLSVVLSFLTICSNNYNLVGGTLTTDSNEVPFNLANNERRTDKYVTLWNLMQKIEEQETRLNLLQTEVKELKEDSKQKAIRIEQLEMTVSRNVKDLIQNGRRISQLESELTNIKIHFEEKQTHQTKLMDELDYFSNTTDDSQRSVEDDDDVVDNMRTVNANSTNDNIQKMKIRTDTITKRVEPSSGVAFSVSLNSDVYVSVREEIKYDHVILDTKNSYNPRSGIYVVPERGVYVFSWTTITDETRATNIVTELVVNGSVRLSSLADAGHLAWDSGTGLIVMRVNKGDLVYIRSETSARVKSTLYQSTFSGWQIF